MISKKTRTSVQLSCLCLTLSLTTPARSEDAGECIRDLQAVAKVLERDYVGYAIARDVAGSPIETALSSARELAVSASGADCDIAIRGFLEVFGDGHLLLMSKHSPPVDMPAPLFQGNRAPIARALSDTAFLIRIPHFGIHHKSAVEALLKEREREIRAREILIVDVRGNTGGADSTWTDLVTPIYSKPMDRWGLQWRPTEGNAKAIEGQVDQMRKGGQASAAVCNAYQQIADGMRENLGDKLVKLGTTTSPVTLPEIWPAPRRVAIIVDGACGSSCENFLLAARQSDKVTVFGATTYGAIDFQNLRQVSLPSGIRTLNVAMSVSERVLTKKQRQRGLSPDVTLGEQLLRDPEEAVEYVLRFVARGDSGAPGT